jgi:hypothetical protein
MARTGRDMHFVRCRCGPCAARTVVRARWRSAAGPSLTPIEFSAGDAHSGTTAAPAVGPSRIFGQSLDQWTQYACNRPNCCGPLQGYGGLAAVQCLTALQCCRAVCNETGVARSRPGMRRGWPARQNCFSRQRTAAGRQQRSRIMSDKGFHRSPSRNRI